MTASLMVRKLGNYPRQDGLAVGLRELGRIERTLLILDWLQNTELRRRVHAGLNKGNRQAGQAAVDDYYVTFHPSPDVDVFSRRHHYRPIWTAAVGLRPAGLA